MKYSYLFLFAMLSFLYFGCGNSEVKFGERSSLSFEYDEITLVKNRIKMKIEVYPEKNPENVVTLNIKNICNENFIFNYDDFFLMQDSKILSTVNIVNHWKGNNIFIHPGEEQKIVISYSASKGKPNRIDFLKRKDDEKQVMFSLQLD